MSQRCQTRICEWHLFYYKFVFNVKTCSNSPVNPYIFIALAVLSAASAKILHKRVLVEGDPFVYAFFQNALSALLFAPFAFSPFAVAQTKAGWLSLSVAVVLWSFIAVASFVSYKYTELAIRTPVAQSRIVWSLVFGTLILGETVTSAHFLAALTIFVGITITLWNPKHVWGTVINKGIVWTFMSAITLALVAIVDKNSLHSFGAETYSFLVYASPAVIIGVFIPSRIKEVKLFLKEKTLKLATLAVVLEALAYYFSVRALVTLDATVVFPLMQVTTIIAVIGGIVVFKETDRLTYKIIGTIVTIAGAVFLV